MDYAPINADRTRTYGDWLTLAFDKLVNPIQYRAQYSGTV